MKSLLRHFSWHIHTSLNDVLRPLIPWIHLIFSVTRFTVLTWQGAASSLTPGVTTCPGQCRRSSVRPGPVSVTSGWWGSGGRWVIRQWSQDSHISLLQCSARCGHGQVHRKVTCLGQCDENTRPHTSEACRAPGHCQVGCTGQEEHYCHHMSHSGSGVADRPLVSLLCRLWRGWAGQARGVRPHRRRRGHDGSQGREVPGTEVRNINQMNRELEGLPFQEEKT